MQSLISILKNKYRQHRLRYEIFQFDRYRKYYDSYSFEDKKKLAGKWLNQYPEQAHFSFVPINYWLSNIVKRPAFVLEIGGWRGDLAEIALSSFNFIEVWHNYDFLSDNNKQKCREKRYKLITLEDYLWRQPLNFEYNALIATHMIEHISWREFTDLAEWIPSSVRTVLFESPLPYSGENINWKGDNSSHILEKGWKQVVHEMKNKGFSADHLGENTYIFIR